MTDPRPGCWPSVVHCAGWLLVFLLTGWLNYRPPSPGPAPTPAPAPVDPTPQPQPAPDPKPQPEPSPAPAPAPVSDTDPKVVDAARAYFRLYLSTYRTAAANATAPYNPVVDQLGKLRTRARDALAAAIDAAQKPKLDGKTGVPVDPDGAARADKVVENSLAAGMKAALADGAEVLNLSSEADSEPAPAPAPVPLDFPDAVSAPLPPGPYAGPLVCVYVGEDAGAFATDLDLAAALARDGRARLLVVRPSDRRLATPAWRARASRFPAAFWFTEKGLFMTTGNARPADAAADLRTIRSAGVRSSIRPAAAARGGAFARVR